MSIVQAQVRIPYDSGLPGDVATNVWHFRAADPDPTNLDMTEILDRLSQFYSAAAAPSVASVASRFSVNLNPAAARLKLYNLAHLSPRAPIADTPINLGAVGSDSLPEECAVVLSFQGLKVSGLPQSRRRGRIFLGPLATTSLSSTPYGRPHSVYRAIIRDSAQRLVRRNDDPIVGQASLVQWVVWSKTAQSAVDVNDGWVDDSFDTQRRRGADPTLRDTFAFA